MVGGDYLQRNIDALAMDGRLVIIGQPGGYKSEINTTPMMRNRLTITGSTLRARRRGKSGDRAGGSPARLAAARVGRGEGDRLRNLSSRAAAEAHRVMESSAHIGKLVLLS